jgi:hypothetical protein
VRELKIKVGNEIPTLYGFSNADAGIIETDDLGCEFLTVRLESSRVWKLQAALFGVYYLFL